jgi:hypothetical protein
VLLFYLGAHPADLRQHPVRKVADANSVGTHRLHGVAQRVREPGGKVVNVVDDPVGVKFGATGDVRPVGVSERPVSAFAVDRNRKPVG